MCFGHGITGRAWFISWTLDILDNQVDSVCLACLIQDRINTLFLSTYKLSFHLVHLVTGLPEHQI